ncbi:MAG TPA: DUF2293 domain-containing protein [Myxococcales bacterium]|jgi:hypothetical protein
MNAGTETNLERRVREAAEKALRDRKFVTPVDVVMGLGWVRIRHVEEWQQGRRDCLEASLPPSPDKIRGALEALRRWAEASGLTPKETPYVARSHDRRALRFTKAGSPEAERAWSTHWFSPELSEARRAKMQERQAKPPDLVVLLPLDDWRCTACGGTGEMLIMDAPGALCLACADLDHLVFLPAGNAAMSRRAKAASKLSAVVVRFARARKRYERKGILVEEQAIRQAEELCLGDEEQRALRRERDGQRRVKMDAVLFEAMAAEIARLFPKCPEERARQIAEHAALRGSGRVGRTAGGRALEEDALRLAVIASIRHLDTDYDELLMNGVHRAEARDRIRAAVDRVLRSWEGR